MPQEKGSLVYSPTPPPLLSKPLIWTALHILLGGFSPTPLTQQHAWHLLGAGHGWALG